MFENFNEMKIYIDSQTRDGISCSCGDRGAICIYYSPMVSADFKTLYLCRGCFRDKVDNYIITYFLLIESLYLLEFELDEHTLFSDKTIELDCVLTEKTAGLWVIALKKVLKIFDARLISWNEYKPGCHISADIEL